MGVTINDGFWHNAIETEGTILSSFALSKPSITPVLSSFTFAYLRFTLEESLENFGMKTALTILLASGICLGSFSAIAPCLAQSDNPKVLKGRVEDQGAKAAPTGLRRTDIEGPDPFSDDNEPEQEVLEASKDAYKIDEPRRPKKGFGLQASEHGPAAMMPMNPLVNPYDGESEPMLPPQAIPQQQPFQQQVQQNDPDSSPDMQLAWDIWHKRVAEAIYTRFNFLAKLGFKRSPPLLCKVSYVVTRDGQVQNIQVTQKSSNVLFNVIVYQTVKSLNGDLNLLQFPQGSRRMFVPKVGTFTQNYGGDGFRYTVGDRETLQGQGR